MYNKDERNKREDNKSPKRKKVPSTVADEDTRVHTHLPTAARTTTSSGQAYSTHEKQIGEGGEGRKS